MTRSEKKVQKHKNDSISGAPRHTVSAEEDSRGGRIENTVNNGNKTSFKLSKLFWKPKTKC
jgi:hypothetical protein